ncbi:EmrB/QacA subfamily drug resistance transporter [Scopulibacillus darangshiensis]|uniref:EmrB/QacA subfamily drug resistance transporter n=1 Tax=Scopulibacillus darangshiensis TaxID=442528 RepID=A0A4R2P8B8_9BACL|nr:MDR family MFS transporter [Scopulibacillus darangshiensis]TCP30548.1 EmrB/QacA subfamily drug resistance transporter [Scopulibacillus darangshiensis]
MNQAMQEGEKRQTNRPLVLLSLILGMFMAAIEGTIVATAIPDIVGDLGGFSLYSWVFSAYLLMNALTILIYGKLADLFGRKPIFIFGVIVFLLGSLLAGFAPSMKLLILFRFIQGFGAGAVQPIALTIVGDLYTMEERAKIQGYLSSVWGISAVIGPALGGVFVEYLDWAWVFWMNIPLGILSLIGTIFFFHENLNQAKHKIDYKGSILLFIAISSVMVVLIQGGVVWSWLSAPTILLVIIFILAMILFILQERKAVEPIVPLSIWKNRLIAIANCVNLTSGIVLIGLSSFLPAFVQVVMGKSAVVAGFTLTAMSIGWPIASTVTGKLLIKYGYKTLAVIGGYALVIGGVFFVLLDPAKGPLWAGIGSFIIGVGMGMISTTFIVSIQNSVKWELRGVATASNMFMRMMGSAVGAAFLGGILNSELKSFIHKKGAGEHLSIDSANQLLGQSGDANLSAPAMNLLREGLTGALHHVYMGVFIFAVISLLLILIIPKKRA